MQAQVEGPGTLTFQWKVSSEAGCDQLQFYLDGNLQDAIDGEQDWDEMSYPVTGSGTHTFRWRYQKDYSLSEGEDASYVDQVQWTVPLPEDPPADRWHHLTYVYDAAGRRIEKQYDYDTVLKYVYDGDHCIAEYDAGGNLRRKYIYGPAVDEPIAMIESTQTYAGTYYYHFDALGSCVALTDSDANTVDVYEYDVYGRVGMLDANHPNRIMFTGREFDKETGLYYYRARYYNPQIGRFLQTDPVGYKAGMNLYQYCANTPQVLIDPMGTQALPPNFWPPYGPDAPEGSKDGLEEWAEALLLMLEFVTGGGPETRLIGDEWKLTAALKDDPRVEKVRQEFRNTNKGKPRSEWVAVTDTEEFTLRHGVEYALDPLHVFGSFTVTVSVAVSVSPGDGGPVEAGCGAELETITVYNRTSWQSLWRITERIPIVRRIGRTLFRTHMTWTRAEFRFFGNIYQTFSWKENVLDEE